MNRITGAVAALLASTGLAQAGALDRGGQPITVIFEDGNYVELTYSLTDPSVEGTLDVPGVPFALESGDVAPEYSLPSLALKYDLSDRLSLALIVDQPFGVDLAYDETGPGYPLAGTNAELSTTAVTALARYRVNDGFSVHGGLRYVAIDANLQVFSPAVPVPGVPAYDATYDEDSDVGFVVGAAYEREAIGLRVALTYSSETEFQNDVAYSVFTPTGPVALTGTTNSYTLPQSVNLDFRTGIAAGTAIIGSVRWVDWSETEITSPNYPTPGNVVVNYGGDYVTTTIGVGRVFSDSFRGQASIIYETEIDETVSDLSPFDGQIGVALGGTYAVGNGLELTGGVRYVKLGAANTGIGAGFDDNSSLTLLARVAYRF